MPYLVLYIILTCVLFVIFKRTRESDNPYQRLPLPPGPKRWPIIGNLLDMPSKFEWETYHRWAKEMSTDILYLDAAGQGIIVLDTKEAAVELLEKQSAIFSGRPRMPMANELMGWDFAFGFMNYGETWRRRRRLVSQEFNTIAVKQFTPHIISSTRRFLQKMMKNPDNVIGNLRHMAADTVFSIVYGLNVELEGRESLLAAEEANRAMLIAVVPGRFMVDFLPFLKHVPSWVPGAQFKRLAHTWKKLTTNMIEMPYHAAMVEVAKGASKTSVVSQNIKKMKKGGNPILYNEESIKTAAGTIYSAGSDTTVSAISSCILALVYNPDVVKRAQKELDDVLLPGHLPSLADEDSLPYITAIVKETLRWRDVTPMAIPHRLTADAEYRGYRLPKESIVIGNSWAMLHDKERYPDPFTFKPERFMKDGKLDTSVPDPEFSCFGFGRRICPGRHIAYSSVWLTVAYLLTVFNIEKAVDEYGNVIEPLDEIECALVCTPKPFKCAISPRSQEWKTEILRDPALDDF